MVQDTRKDPRAKVLTMTVRYKSATIDEFIEHHSHDISRGGVFIKTPSPFPPGTLLKFEIRIAEDKPILGGVGRVVWKREPPDATDESPAGMGVKFLKIEEQSKAVIDEIVTKHGPEPSAFEQGSDEFSDKDDEPAPKKVQSHKATMLGLGAVQIPDDPSKEGDKDATGDSSDAAEDGGSFFPKTDSEKDMPPPEERTVMKQAAELLAEALKGAGGSMDEVGDVTEGVDEAEDKKSEPEDEKSEPEDKKPESEDEKPEPEDKKPEPEKEKAAVAPAPSSSDTTPPKAKDERESVRPAPAAAAAPSPAPEEDSSGSTKTLLFIALIILVGAAIYLGTQSKGTADTESTGPTEPTATQPAQTATEPTASAQQQDSGAAAKTEDAAAKTEDAAAKAEDAAPDAEEDAGNPEKPAAPVQTAAPKPKATAKPVAPKPKATAKPVAPKPKATAKPKPKPKATAKPKPKPKPKPPADDDNPY